MDFWLFPLEELLLDCGDEPIGCGSDVETSEVFERPRESGPEEPNAAMGLMDEVGGGATLAHSFAHISCDTIGCKPLLDQLTKHRLITSVSYHFIAHYPVIPHHPSPRHDLLYCAAGSCV
jgi:hypothetical protein